MAHAEKGRWLRPVDKKNVNDVTEIASKVIPLALLVLPLLLL